MVPTIFMYFMPLSRLARLPKLNENPKWKKSPKDDEPDDPAAGLDVAAGSDVADVADADESVGTVVTALLESDVAVALVELATAGCPRLCVAEADVEGAPPKPPNGFPNGKLKPLGIPGIENGKPPAPPVGAPPAGTTAVVPFDPAPGSTPVGLTALAEGEPDCAEVVLGMVPDSSV